MTHFWPPAVDAAYCYRLSNVVCRSACLSATVVNPAKTAQPMDMPSGLRIRVGPGNHLLDEAQISWVWAILRSEMAPIVLYAELRKKG